jgi:hypothetical protein
MLLESTASFPAIFFVAIIGVIVFIALSELCLIRTSEVSAKFRRYTASKRKPRACRGFECVTSREA